MKRYILLFLLCLLPVCSQAACDGSFTPTSCGTYCWQACDSSDDAAQAAVNASEASWNIANEVKIPTGTANWTSAGAAACNNNYSSSCALCMVRGVKLTGAGVGSTVITITSTDTDYPSGICYQPNSQPRLDNEPFEMSGFTIDSGTRDYLSGVVNVYNFTNNAIMTKIKIHNNTFQNGWHAIYMMGDITGVVYSNTFNGIDTVIKGSSGSAWSKLTRAYGTVSATFFEDNTITNTDSVANGSGTFTSGAGHVGLVYRYNTSDLNSVRWPSGQFWDLHGLQSMRDAGGTDQDCGYDGHPACNPTGDYATEFSQFASEIYGNIFTNYYEPNDATVEWIRLRGSWMLMFNNRLSGSIAGSGAYPSPTFFEYACDTAQSPASPVYSQHIQNVYSFNNWANNTEKPMIINPYTANYTPSGTGTADFCASAGGYAITENTDYWNYNATPVNGSTQKGINCGSAVPSSSCSLGDAYWRTTASPCSTPPATMADMKTYTQTGTLYTCNGSNTWVDYYTPYTYPHPLRGEAIAGTPVITIGTGPVTTLGSGPVWTLK